MQMNTGISIASLVVSVITLAIVLMLLADKPGEPSSFELEMSRGISEAQRLEACAAIGDMYHLLRSHSNQSTASVIGGFLRMNDGLNHRTITDNQCTDDEIGWERPDPKDAN